MAKTDNGPYYEHPRILLSPNAVAVTQELPCGIAGSGLPYRGQLFHGWPTDSHASKVFVLRRAS
jgi:hypothetical protein